MYPQENTSAKMCGYYSITSDRIFDESPSSLKYFKLPKVPLDLNKGIKDIKQKPDSYYEEKMDSILTYIMKNKARLVKYKDHREKKTALIPSTNYITYRGVIRMIMCSPYEKRNWCIIATKYKGNIYMCQFTLPFKHLAFKNEPFSSKKFAFYGPKFEQYCLSDDPTQLPDTSERLDECAQFFCVFKRKLVGRNFLFAGEMDGLDSDTPVNLHNPDNYKDLKFIELKVTAAPHSSPYNEQNFKKNKCPNIWTQSFLTGVKDIYFGFRGHNGIVNEIEHYHIDRLRHNWEKYWDPSKCFNFLNFFLEVVEDELEDIDCPDTVFEFNYNVETGAISHIRHEGKTDFSLLPQWYLEDVNS